MNIQTRTASSLLERYPLSAIRRNHALEHATLHVLARSQPRQGLAGHSDAGGFWIVGKVSNEAVRMAVAEALQRLQGGEHQLAVHPNCGTNFVTAGTLAGLAGALAMFGAGQGRREKLERLPLAVSLATLALVFSQPLGSFLQARVTTASDLTNLQVLGVKTSRRGRLLAHRILTHQS